MSYPESIKLNTIELEGGINPNGDISKYCDVGISGEVLDKVEDVFFSESKLREYFGPNYKDNIVDVPQADGSIRKVIIPGLVGGGMGTNVSSSNGVESMNKMGLSAHLSSIGIGFYFYEKKEKDFYKKEYKEIKNIVDKDFEEIFVNKLGLSQYFIQKHFFKCYDLGETEKNKGFNVVSGKGNIMRKMDLVALYETINDLKSNGNNVGLNVMYKTSSYIATLKLSCILGLDYVTTAAGNPEINPKEFLNDFYLDAEKDGLKLNIPAFGLIISSSRILSDFDYDYYVFEEGKTAGGHIIRVGKTDKFNDFKKIKDKFEKAGKGNTPIYAAGGVFSNETLKEVLEIGYDGFQIGTLYAVSEEAVNGEGEEFKNRLISGNHLGEKKDIDNISEKELNLLEKKLKRYVGFYNSKIINFLSEEYNIDTNQENEEISNLRNYLYKIIYKKFYDKGFDESNFSEEDLDKIKSIENFIDKSFGNDQEKINKVFRNYGNAKKFLEELETFRLKNDGVNPTHLVFDSTVGFPGRTRITGDLARVFAGRFKSSGCINCLTDCILANRGGIIESKGSTFCIYDWLDQTDNSKQNIAFSGLSTVPYPEIRPIKDIIAYLMGVYIKR